MAGYSGTPLPRKLGIKDGHRICVIDAPSGNLDQLAPLPSAVALFTNLRGRVPFDVLLLFATSQRGLTRRFAAMQERMQPAAGLWVCWPKKSSGVATDLSEGVVREFGLATGLVDNKVCAIDDTWSALRFVIRVKDR